MKWIGWWSLQMITVLVAFVDGIAILTVLYFGLHDILMQVC